MFEKAKKFVKEHKKQIIVGTVIAGVTVSYIVSKGKAAKVPESVAAAPKPAFPDDIPTPDSLINLGAADTIDNYGNCLELMGTTMKANQMGEFGELLQSIPGVTGDCDVWTLVNITIPKTV